MNKDIKIVLQIQKINPQPRPRAAGRHGIGKLVNVSRVRAPLMGAGVMVKSGHKAAPSGELVRGAEHQPVSTTPVQLIITALDSSEWGDLTEVQSKAVRSVIRSPEPHFAGRKGSYSMIISPEGDCVLTKSESIKELYTVLGENKQIKGLLEGKLRNIIKGLTTKHKKRMVLNGVGYWIKQESNELGNWLDINIGYKDPIRKKIPSNIDIEIGNFEGQNNELICESNNLEELTNWMSSIRQLKPGYKDKYKRKGWSSIS